MVARQSDLPGLRRSAAAFILVEVVVSLGLLAVVMGAFIVALNSGSDALMAGCAKGIAVSQLDQAVKMVEADLRETAGASIATTEAGLPQGQCAMLLPTARDSAGVFHVDSSGRRVWQGIVVYCPYVTPAGVSELRRYVHYAPPEDFPFWFQGETPITETQIALGSSGGAVTISRASGNPALPEGRKFQALCPGMTAFDVTVGNPSTATLQAECKSRRNRIIVSEETANVAQRN